LPLRKLLFWIHLAAGVTAGLVILTMSVTGVLLAFERQVVGWAERDLRATSEEARKEPLPISTIVGAAVAASPNAKLSNITLRADRLAPVTVSFGRERTLFVNRYSGAVLGEGAIGVRRFFRTNQDVHRWLALKGDRREVGKKITGISNLIFLFIVISGLYIWVPKRKTRAAFRNVSLFRGGLRGRVRDFNWHNVLGVWSFVPLLLIVFSGVVISFPPPSNAPRNDGPSRKPAADFTALDPLFHAAVSEAGRVAPDWRTLGVRLPLSGKEVTVSLDTGNGARPDKRSQLVIDPADARLIEHKTYASQKSEQKARSWLRWIHTGEAGGMVGQFVAALASAAAVLLVWTGISLALRRFTRWLRGIPQPNPNSELAEEISKS
jgi:uncharacterized iron-regulated membrane protein